MKSRADEEAQSALSKIVRLPYVKEYTCSLPSKYPAMLRLAVDNSSGAAPCFVSRVRRVHIWQRTTLIGQYKICHYVTPIKRNSVPICGYLCEVPLNAGGSCAQVPLKRAANAMEYKTKQVPLRPFTNREICDPCGTSHLWRRSIIQRKEPGARNSKSSTRGGELGSAGYEIPLWMSLRATL